MWQTRSLHGGGRGRNGLVSSETWSVAKWGLTCWRGGRGRSGLVSSETWHIAKRGLTCWRGGRGRSGLVSSETWHVANEDSLAGRRREGGVGELRNVGGTKPGPPDRTARRCKRPHISSGICLF